MPSFIAYVDVVVTGWLPWTALPNLHPALVHFPIAFLPLAVVFEVAALWRAAGSWLDRAAIAVWAAAGLGAGAAFWAGRRAADSLLLEPAVQAHVNTHADWGLYSVWALGLASTARLVYAIWEARREGNAGRRLAGGLFTLVGLAVLAVVAHTADLGGGLVYRHGVAVAGEALHVDTGERAAAGEGGEIAADREGEVGDRLRRTEDGTLTWTPAPGDAAALGDLLTAAPGSSLAAVAVAEVNAAGEGLALAVDGRALLLLPGTFGDVQVEAVLDLAGFTGTVGVAHHARGAADAGLLGVEVPAGRVALITLDDGEAHTLGAATRRLGDGPLRLTVSAIGRHLRGLIGDELAVHGHEPALPDGGCGLLLNGTGTLRVVSLKIVPA